MYSAKTEIKKTQINSGKQLCTSYALNTEQCTLMQDLT
uniref:Uncharacterized protein n=1 Tax=Anguilla anguilla TaxID=7936 RepID=A0A0E9XC40_ANGAN